MKLTDYITQENITPTEFAEALGVPVPTAWRYINGQRVPRIGTLRRIAELTNGRVTPNDFYDLGSDAPPP